ncbi:hypothetical protein ACQP3J_30485, partial [Escherichia coli]
QTTWKLSGEFVLDSGFSSLRDFVYSVHAYEVLFTPLMGIHFFLIDIRTFINTETHIRQIL